MEGLTEFTITKPKHSRWCPQRNPIFTVAEQENQEGAVITVEQTSQVTQTGRSA